MNSFTAIDFETAQGKRWSICQVGLVRVENQIITEQLSIGVLIPEKKRTTEFGGNSNNFMEKSKEVEKRKLLKNKSHLLHNIKEKMKEIEIRDFELSYDGMYIIKWDNHVKRVFLELNVILKMLEIEGLTCEDVENCIKSSNPIKFTKVAMNIRGEEDDEGKLTYMVSEWSDMYYGMRNLTMMDINLKGSL